MRYLSYAPPLDFDFGMADEFGDRLIQRSFELLNEDCTLEELNHAIKMQLSPEQFELLRAHVVAFDEWLVMNFAAQRVEKNVDLSVSEQRPGSSDLVDLAETEAGFWMVVRRPLQGNPADYFADFLPELLDYRERVARIRPAKPVLGIVIDWVYAGGATLYPVHRYL